MIQVASNTKEVKEQTSVVRRLAPSRYIVTTHRFTLPSAVRRWYSVNTRTWRFVLRAILCLAVRVDQSAHAVVRVPVASFSEAALQMRDAGDGLACQTCSIYTQWHSVANLATIMRYSHTAGNKPQGRDVEEVRPVGFQMYFFAANTSKGGAVQAQIKVIKQGASLL